MKLILIKDIAVQEKSQNTGKLIAVAYLFVFA